MEKKNKPWTKKKEKKVKITYEPGIIPLSPLKVHTEKCEIKRASQGINFAHLLWRWDQWYAEVMEIKPGDSLQTIARNIRCFVHLNITLERKREFNCKMWGWVCSPDATHTQIQSISHFISAFFMNLRDFPFPLSPLIRDLCLGILPQVQAPSITRGEHSCHCVCPGTRLPPSVMTQTSWSQRVDKLCKPKRCSGQLVLWVCV